MTFNRAEFLAEMERLTKMEIPFLENEYKTQFGEHNMKSHSQTNLQLMTIKKILCFILFASMLGTSASGLAVVFKKTCVDSILDESARARKNASDNLVQQIQVIQKIAISDSRYKEDKEAADLLLPAISTVTIINTALGWGAYLNDYMSYGMVVKKGWEKENKEIDEINDQHIRLLKSALESVLRDANSVLLLDIFSRGLRDSILVFRDQVQAKVGKLSNCVN